MSFPQPPALGAYPAGPGYAVAPPAPSGGTAITAGVLAILGGLVAAFGTIAAFAGIAIVAAAESEYSELNSQYGSTGSLDTGLPDWFGGYLVGTGIVNLIVAILLVVGAIMLFIKKSAGRFMVIAGCGLVIVAGIVGLIATSSLAEDLPGDSLGVGGSVLGMLMLVFPIATLVLAAVPPTARWCAHRNSLAPGAPGFPQPGQFQPHPGQYPAQAPPQNQAQQHPGQW